MNVVPLRGRGGGQRGSLTAVRASSGASADAPPSLTAVRASSGPPADAPPSLFAVPAPASARPPEAAGGAGPAGPVIRACDACLRRSALVAALAGRIEHARRDGSRRLTGLLSLPDADLVRALAPVAGHVTAAYRAFDAERARAGIAAVGAHAVCRHDEGYPDGLRTLPDAPAVLHVAGGLDRLLALTAADRPAVAIVGARRASGYGLEVARALGRGVAVADVPVISGMALGVDSAAHAGALEARGPTVAVLAGGVDRPYPPSKHRLYQAIRRDGCVVSEMPPGTGAFRWCFPARNRIIAALATVTVVVEAAERSGSLITAELARDLGREVGAVPGRVTSPASTGTNALLADGAHVIRGPEDALDLACGIGAWRARAPASRVPDHLAALLLAVGDGRDSLDDLAAAGFEIATAMAGLAELELHGHVRRTAGGRYLVCR